MFSSIGLPELLVIVVILLLLFGTKRLPELGGSLGRAINEFKRGLSGSDSRPALSARADATADRPEESPSDSHSHPAV